jgi:hypothetical protein
MSRLYGVYTAGDMMDSCEFSQSQNDIIDLILILYAIERKIWIR